MLSNPYPKTQTGGAGRRKVSDMLINRFGDASLIPKIILKGKNLQRGFWTVFTLENMDFVKKPDDEFV
jgi:hypothetical protein